MSQSRGSTGHTALAVRGRPISSCGALVPSGEVSRRRRRHRRTRPSPRSAERPSREDAHGVQRLVERDASRSRSRTSGCAAAPTAASRTEATARSCRGATSRRYDRARGRTSGSACASRDGGERRRLPNRSVQPDGRGRRTAGEHGAYRGRGHDSSGSVVTAEPRYVERASSRSPSRTAGCGATRGRRVRLDRGANGRSYRLTSSDVNHKIRFNVTARNSIGSTTVMSGESPIVTEPLPSGRDQAAERRDLDPGVERPLEPPSDRVAGALRRPTR